MIRRLLFEMLLFLAPFALYFLYWRMTPARAGEAGTPERTHPWNYLVVAGLALVALSFVVLGLAEGTGQQGQYVAPHVVNGRVVPGKVVPDGHP
jgi:inner membrane protein involved in colicin E2 resistance